MNFGIEFFRQQEVSISCTEKEVKLVTGSKGQERLTRLCSAYGKPFPFMIKGRRVDKENKKYVLILPAVWKAEKRETGSKSPGYMGGSSREEVMGCREGNFPCRKCETSQGENRR